MSRAREIADLIGGTTPDIILKTADGAILNLQTSDTTVTASSVLGEINFQAPDEASGTDAILVAANIEAVAEDTFDSSTNATKLVFKTGASAAADSKFEIASDGSLSTPTAGTSNVRFGVNAGNSIASGGNYNVVVGDEAGTALTTGDNNVAVGFEALKTEDADGNNVAIGYQALKTLNAGASGENVAVGYKSLTAVSTGISNVAVGYLAGEDLSTGTDNTFIGTEAGKNTTDRNHNTAIGNQTLFTNVNGAKNVAVGSGALLTMNPATDADTYNVAVGYDAGGLITTGDKNAIVGGQAGDALTTGFNNTVVGYSALSSNTASGAHVAIGYQALETMDSATNTSQFNVAVGTQAGKSVTSGTYNTLLGPQAGFNITSGAKNTIIGQFDGNNHSLDIRTSNNFVVLSDGDGKPWAHTTGSGSGVWKFMGEGASAEGIGYHAHEFGHDNNDTQMMIMKEHHGSFASVLLDLRCARTASTAYDFLQGRSDGTSDTEFRVRGDGAVTSDNGFDGSGADYAEYFEWSDGNSDSQDRTGYTVVLDGEKIKLATSDDAAANVIGAVSVNPSVVGDSDILRWKQKYLKDDFGAYIFEDYNVEDDDGNTVVQQRRKLNPDYNEDKEYISREDRKEWATIGMMGKLRIRKGQPTGDRWIKMRDVSDTVEEWLVR